MEQEVSELKNKLTELETFLTENNISYQPHVQKVRSSTSGSPSSTVIQQQQQQDQGSILSDLTSGPNLSGNDGTLGTNAPTIVSLFDAPTSASSSSFSSSSASSSVLSTDENPSINIEDELSLENLLTKGQEATENVTLDENL